MLPVASAAVIFKVVIILFIVDTVKPAVSGHSQIDRQIS